MHNVKSELFNKTLFERLDTFVTCDIDERYDGEYIGIVVNNNDSSDTEKFGKCQIRVYGIYEDTIKNSDLSWALPMQSFVGSELGDFCVPTVGSKVLVRFDGGDIYLPIYSTKVPETGRLPVGRGTDYPNNVVMWEFKNGTSLAINRNTEEVVIKHKSLSKIVIDSSGITIEGPVTKIVNNATVEIEGSVVPPTGKGPFCAIPICPYTGQAHTGNIVTK
jgi:hypothetical protein